MFITTNNPQGIIPQQSKIQKTPNFKALVVEQNLKHKIRSAYHPAINQLEHLKDKFADFKFWDLKVVACASAPLFLLQNKENGITYNAIPERIHPPINHNHSSLGKYFVPCEMFAPPGRNNGYSEHKTISPIDTSNGNHRYTVNITYDSQNEAQNTFEKICNFQNENANRVIIDEDYINYPLFVLEEFEKSSAKKKELDKKISDIESRTETKTQKSYVVKEADKNIIQGTKAVSQDDEKKGFAKVSGMEKLKETLREDVILPLQKVELYKKYGIMPANGILLYGPPGTGKTFIAEALAEESGRTFLKMDVAETESKYVGDTGKNIAQIFKEAEEKAPSIIFIDEMEALAPSRNDLQGDSSAAVGYNQSVNTLLQKMNNCAEKGIFVIAASNEPQKIDSAIKRVGRLDKNIFVPPPDYEARKDLFKMALENIYAEENIDYNKLAELTENYTAPEIQKIIVRQAALNALKQNRKISESDLLKIIGEYNPQLNSETIAEYKTKGEINKNSNHKPIPKIGFIQ